LAILPPTGVMTSVRFVSLPRGAPVTYLTFPSEFIFLYNHAWVEGAHEDAKYAVLDQSAGDGAFARVFAARYNGGQIVAVKVLNRAAILKRARGRCDTAQETFERDMVREAQIHKGLKHPFIVTFIAHRRFKGDCGA
jgi:serine/threonine protein kinase